MAVTNEQIAGAIQYVEWVARVLRGGTWRLNPRIQQELARFLERFVQQTERNQKRLTLAYGAGAQTFRSEDFILMSLFRSVRAALPSRRRRMSPGEVASSAERIVAVFRRHGRETNVQQMTEMLRKLPVTGTPTDKADRLLQMHGFRGYGSFYGKRQLEPKARAEGERLAFCVLDSRLEDLVDRTEARRRKRDTAIVLAKTIEPPPGFNRR